MKGFLLFLSALFLTLSQFAQISIIDSSKFEGYIEYINAKEKEILADKEERQKLEAAKVETDSLLKIDKDEHDVLLAEEKKIRLDVNRIQTSLSNSEEAITYNKGRIKSLSEEQLATKKEADLKSLDLTKTKQELIGFEQQYNTSSQKITTSKKEISTKENEISELDIKVKSSANDVDVLKTEVASMTSQIIAVNDRNTALEEEIQEQKNVVEQKEELLISEKKEYEEYISLIQKDQSELEGFKEAKKEWGSQLADVNRMMAALENSKASKKSDLNKTPDSLKTSKLLESYQQEMRMIEDKITKLSTEKKDLEKDINSYSEKIKVTQSDLATNENAMNLANSKVQSLQKEVANEEEKLNQKKKESQELGIKIHDLSTDKEQKSIALQKVESEYTYHKSEYDRKQQELETDKEDLEELKVQNKKFLNKRDSLSTQKMAIEQDVEKLNAQNSKQKSDLEELKKQQTNLEEGVDTLTRANEKILHQQKVNAKAIELNEAEVNKLKDDLDLINSRLKELDNPAEDEVLKGISQAKSGNYDALLTTLGSALETDKNKARSQTVMGYTYYVKGEVDKAESSYTEAINESPRYLDPYVLRAELREDKKNYIAALKDYNQVTYLDSSKGDAYYKQGVLLHYFLNEPDEACESWKLAFKLGVEKANEKLVEHCSQSSDSRFYLVTQLTKRAIEDDYGISEYNPIKVGKNKERLDYNISLYLDLLRDTKGQPVKYVRLGSCCRYETDNGLRNQGLLEKYRVTFKNSEGKKEDVVLFFTYYDFDKPMVPKGFNTNHEIY